MTSSVAEIIEQRGIEQVFHFTTQPGLLGVLATRALKARSELDDDQYLERIFTPNNTRRKDGMWSSHVSLSISRVNTTFFGISSGAWHGTKNYWWCILSFRPEVLAATGTQFVTTNNIYPSARRATGASGLDALFAEAVPARYSALQRRYPGMPSSWPTCIQAEALHPGEISTMHLQRIYVQDEMHAAVAESQLGAVSHPDVEIAVNREIFSAGYPR